VGGLIRVAHWERVLAEQIQAAQKREYQWGVFDCCLFAADVVQAITGVDLAAEFRGKYKTAAGATRELKKYAGTSKLSDTLGIIMTKHGCKMIRPGWAGRGDVVVILDDLRDGSFGEVCGICVGANGVAVPVAPVGIKFTRAGTAVAAWCI
jgi:hypothetical protein